MNGFWPEEAPAFQTTYEGAIRRARGVLRDRLYAILPGMDGDTAEIVKAIDALIQAHCVESARANTYFDSSKIPV